MKKSKAPKFASEAELCARFIAAVDKEWTSYAETGSWDILLVRSADGFQIGIQAKLKLNAHVFSQAIEDGRSYSAQRPGPDCRAVMVPSGESGWFGIIAGYIGITIISVRHPDCGLNFRYNSAFTPYLPKLRDGFLSDDWHECCQMKRHKLPEYVPDVAAGASSPLQLTDWKIAAIKLAITLERRGFLTRADFKHHGIDYRRWIAVGSEWLRIDAGRYVAGARLPNFKAQHPRVWEEIAADSKRWMRVESSSQTALL